VRLSDDEVANVLTYILNTWGNEGGEIVPRQVDAQRKSKP
jgi:nitrite reductase (NO-forming)